ncbi:PAS domain-containing protein [Rhodovibrionaceae bacterium A322]
MSEGEKLQAAAPQEGNGVNEGDEDLSRLLSISEVHRTVFDYWSSLKGETPLPLKSSFDPISLVKVLPHVVMRQVHRDPLDFQFRVFGTRIAKEVGHDPTGTYQSQDPRYCEGNFLWRECAVIVESKGYYALPIPYAGPNRQIKTSSSLSLPLSNDGQEVDYILTSIDFHAHSEEKPIDLSQW